MTNAALQALIDANSKDRIFCINLDNSRFIYIGYNNGITMDDISFETIGGIDFIAVSKTTKAMGSTELKYKTYHLTETVQWVGVMEEEFKDFRPDPMLFR